MLGDISVRLMVEQPDITSATGDALALTATLADFGQPVALSVKPYWKIATYYEIAVTLRSENPESALRRVADTLTPEWHWLPQNAVWDHRKHAGLKLPVLATSARWAEIVVSHDGGAAGPKPARGGKKKRTTAAKSSRRARRRIS